MKSNKFLILGFSGIALFFAVYFSLNSKTAVLPSSQVTTTEPPSLFQQAQAHPGLTQSHLSEEDSSSECKPVLEAIETLPLKTLIYDLTTGKMKLDAKCLFHKKKEAKILDGFPEVCVQLKDGQPTADCVSKLFFYKALRIQNATMGQNLDNLETEVIIQKLMGILTGQSEISADESKQIREIGVKLYERLPDSAAAAKAASVGFISAEQLTPEESAQFDKILDESRTKFPSNWELYEIDLIRKRGRDEAEFKKSVVDYYAANPNSPIARYYMGCMKWSEKEVTAAREFFHSAVAIAPNDARFKATYDHALAATPPEKVCTVQINFDPEKF